MSDRIVAFGRLLRRVGLRVGSQQMIDALRAVEVVGINRKRDVRHALFGVFVSRHEDFDLFEQAFALFWHLGAADSTPVQDMLPDLGKKKNPVRSRVQDALSDVFDTDLEKDARQAISYDTFATYSAVERLRRKDFADCTAAELAAARRMLREMVWPIAPRRARRLRSRKSGRRVQLRKTLRQNLRFAGEFIDLRMQGPTTKPRPVIVLCDISGSMEPYARMFLHFMHAITGGLDRVESFVFGTRLTRITRCLLRRDVDEAVAEASRMVCDWAGGTRIGEALREFNWHWLRRVLRSGGVVLIISDGCDRGDDGLLSREMERLRRGCHRLIWLNPLLGYDAYEPLTKGMLAALPHVSDFLPVHNLEALEDLGAVLSGLERHGRTGPPCVYSDGMQLAPETL